MWKLLYNTATEGWGVVFPAGAWSFWVKRGEVMGPISPCVAVDGVEIHSIAKGLTHTGRETHC